MASSLYQRLASQSAALDQLLSDVAIGVKSPTHFDQLEAKAQAVSRGIKDSFRRCDPRA